MAATGMWATVAGAQSESSPAEPGPARHLAATAVEAEGIRLDGRLDEAAWRAAAKAEGFVQREPQPGAASSERTDAYVLFDDRAVYVGMRMHESHPDGVRAQLSRRDGTAAASDWAMVMIDSYHDRRTAFKFATTPYGVRNDAMLYEDTREDASWDAVWQVATTRDADGWTAEFRIPLSQLRFASAGSERPEWGIQFAREVAHLREVSYWARVLPTDGGFVSLFGALTAPSVIRPARRVELLPYTVGRLEQAPGSAANPFYERRATSAAFGADAKMGLTSNMTLTATINPDFGQVEADPSVVNLGAFENFFTERRPFFTEGAEIFRFNLVPEGFAFYSRRIGRTPQRSAPTPAGGFVDAPTTSRILGAAKLSGKTSTGWSLGLLGAVTEATDARVADSTGAVSLEPIEPRTTHLVARVMRDFRRGQSGLGGIATYVDRDLDDARLTQLRDRAYASGLNGWHRWGGNRYEVSGWVLGSMVTGSEAALAATQRSAVHRFQRPDASHLTYDSTRTSLGGSAGELYIRKIGGGPWIAHLGGGWRSPGLEVNDGGYQTYADTWYYYPRITYRQFQPGPILRTWSIATGFVQQGTYGGERGREHYILALTSQFRNFWTSNLTLERWEEADNTVVLRGGPSVIEPGYTITTWTGTTDRRLPTSFEASLRSEYSEVSDRHTLRAQLTYNTVPTPSLALSVEPTMTLNRDPRQWIRTVQAGGPHYLMGSLQQRTAALVLRAAYAVTANLALDVYLQPFISAGDYTRFHEVRAPNARFWSDRYTTFADDQIALDAATNRYAVDANRDATPEFSFPNPDFTVRELRSNVVLRWEFTPGSTVFLVWSEARDDRAVLEGFSLGRDTRRLFSAPAQDVFLLKVSYWLGR